MEADPSQVLDRFDEYVNATFQKPLTRPEIQSVFQQHKDILREPSVGSLAHLRKKPFDFLVDEVMASIPFIDKYHFEPDRRFLYPRDDGPIDLRVTGSGCIEDCQITRAHDGQRSRLQDELLAAEGRAPGTGVLYRDPKTKRAMGISAARRRDDSVRDALRWLSSILAKKAAKSYPPDMTLICAISRWEFNLHDEENYDVLIEVASQFLPRLHFKKVYLSQMYDDTSIWQLK